MKSPVTSPGLRSGWLHKRGEKGMQLYLDLAWKKRLPVHYFPPFLTSRFFISDPNEAVMKYFESESSTSALGAIDFTKVKGVGMDGHVLKIITFQNQQRREWLLRSEKDINAWYTYVQDMLGASLFVTCLRFASNYSEFYLIYSNRCNSSHS
jgi:hypothetical protein